jgi:DNA repair photolyase
MGIACGTQIVLCDMPIHFDTYKGCSHACRYCFVKRNTDISKIERDNCIKQLKRFISGERTKETNWCDWNIPLHWGGVSDPFQPVERKYGISYQCLQLFAETGYPFIVSTKGKLLATDKYLSMLKKCNAVVQLSMVCSKYDIIEQGCPSYEERLVMARKIAPNCKRLIVRLQPYMTEVFRDVLENIPRLKEAGVYGVTIEGMKFVKKKAGLVKVGGDYCYPVDILEKHFIAIKKECHKHGLKFYSAENRLRVLGDHMTCCGIDGLEGFTGNSYNLSHMYNGGAKATQCMGCKGTASCFNSLKQKAGYSKFLKDKSLEDMMTAYYNEGLYKDALKYTGHKMSRNVIKN